MAAAIRKMLSVPPGNGYMEGAVRGGEATAEAVAAL